MEPTTNFTRDDIGFSGGQLSALNATSSTVYTATFTPNSNASCSINVVYATFTDSAGNDNTALYSDGSAFTFTHDVVSPVLAITSNASATDNQADVTLAFTATEDNLASFDSTKITVDNGGSLSGYSSNGTGIETVTLNVTNQGVHTISAAAGAFMDDMGHASAAQTFTYTYDSVSPVLPITSNPSATDNQAAVTL